MRDKVAWDPAKHGWKVYVKKPTAVLKPFQDHSGGSLYVDPGLDITMYAEEKKAKYVKAIETWNAVYGSTRSRVPTTSIPDAE